MTAGEAPPFERPLDRRVDLRLYAIIDPEHSHGHDLAALARAVAAGSGPLLVTTGPRSQGRSGIR